MKKVILVIFLLAIIGGGIFFYNQYRTAKQARSELSNLETAILAKGSLDEVISATGKLRSVQTATLTWKTSGTVDRVNVKVGDSVKAGDILATLQQTSLPQNVILAQSDLVNAKKTLDDLDSQAEIAKVNALQNISKLEQQVKDAKYQLDNFTAPTNMAGLSITDAVVQMKARLDEARQAFEPYKFYPENNQIRKDLKEALDSAQSDYNTAVKRLQLEYNLEVADANLQKSWGDFNKWKNGPDPADIDATKARIAAAQATLNQAWISAPFNGKITLSEPMPGDQVTPNQIAFRLDDLGEMYVDLQVSEVDISQIEPGQLATITVDALRNKVYHGEVESVGMVSSTNQNVVNFPVTIKITDPDSELRPGMTCEVKILVNQKNDILLIPIQAVKVEDGKQVVYLMNTGQPPTPVEVTLGISSDTFSELVSGNLKLGDVIVLSSLATDSQGLFQRPFMFGGDRNGRSQNSPTPNTEPFGSHPEGIPTGGIP